MTTRVPVKSILKQQGTSSTAAIVTDEQRAKAEKDRANLKLALKHAYKIQQQKDVTAQILVSIELLASIPASDEPTAEEGQDFTERVADFQPSDFDDLIDERRVEGRCGYALCRKQPRSLATSTSASWRVTHEGRDFCSAHCMRKAFYIKSQLSGVPAWEREPGRTPQILLYEDGQSIDPPTSAQTPASSVQDLAAERGDAPSSPSRSTSVMTAQVVEKPLSTTVKENVPLASGQSHNAIEGYEPKSNFKRTTVGGTDNVSDDEDDDQGSEVDE